MGELGWGHPTHLECGCSEDLFEDLTHLAREEVRLGLEMSDSAQGGVESHVEEGTFPPSTEEPERA